MQKHTDSKRRGMILTDQRKSLYAKDGEEFVIKKLMNVVDYTIGTSISKAEVQELLDTTDIEIRIE
jgi:hypothetical protein